MVVLPATVETDKQLGIGRMHRQADRGGIVDPGIDIENERNPFAHRTKLPCFGVSASALIQPATGGVSVICDSVTTSMNQGRPSASAFASAGLTSAGSVTWVDWNPNPRAIAGVVDRIEIDREVVVVVIEVLQLLDPAEAAVVGVDEDDRQIQARDRFQFAARHAEAAIGRKADHRRIGPRLGCAHHRRNRVAETAVRARNDRRAARAVAAGTARRDTGSASLDRPRSARRRRAALAGRQRAPAV